MRAFVKIIFLVLLVVGVGTLRTESTSHAQTAFCNGCSIRCVGSSDDGAPSIAAIVICSKLGQKRCRPMCYRTHEEDRNYLIDSIMAMGQQSRKKAKWIAENEFDYEDNGDYGPFHAEVVVCHQAGHQTVC